MSPLSPQVPQVKRVGRMHNWGYEVRLGDTVLGTIRKKIIRRPSGFPHCGPISQRVWFVVGREEEHHMKLKDAVKHLYQEAGCPIVDVNLNKASWT